MAIFAEMYKLTKQNPSEVWGFSFPWREKELSILNYDYHMTTWLSYYPIPLIFKDKNT